MFKHQYGTESKSLYFSNSILVYSSQSWYQVPKMLHYYCHWKPALPVPARRVTFSYLTTGVFLYQPPRSIWFILSFCRNRNGSAVQKSYKILSVRHLGLPLPCTYQLSFKDHVKSYKPHIVQYTVGLHQKLLLLSFVIITNYY